MIWLGLTSLLAAPLFLGLDCEPRQRWCFQRQGVVLPDKTAGLLLGAPLGFQESKFDICGELLNVALRDNPEFSLLFHKR